MARHSSIYLAPPPYEVGGQRNETEILAWLNRSLAESQQFLESQPAWGYVDSGMAAILGDDNNIKIPDGLSRVYVNRTKRQTREVIATLSNLRPAWGFACDNKEFDDQTKIFNNLMKGWFTNSFADRSVRGAIQLAAGRGTGYVSPKFELDRAGIAGRGEIVLDVFGPKDIFPIQLPRNNDLQKAYAVVIRDEIPIARAHAIWPEHADQIVPSRSEPTWMYKGLRKVWKSTGSLVLQMFGGARDRDIREPIFPTVDIFYCYIQDTSVNLTGRTILMGEPGMTWSYEVPSFITNGQVSEVETGFKNSMGEPVMRKRTREECMLYPRRRLIITTPNCLLRDGPNYYWHGKVPLAPFRLDDWEGMYLGFPITRETEAIQKTLISLYRAVDDSCNGRLQPPLKYDPNTHSKGLVQRLNTRIPGQKIPVNTAMGEVLEPLLDPEYYNVPDFIFKFIDMLKAEGDHVMGVQDASALAKASQTPAGDTIEKILEMAGPLITDMSRGMERSLRDLGDMVKWMFMQFYTTKRVVQLLGPDGITPEFFNFDPGNMIPDTVDGRPGLTLIERAAIHGDQFKMYVVPNSLHNITQMTRKLFYVQLARGGFPLDPWTQAEIFDIPNFGRPPEGADTVMQRWREWMKIQAEMGGQQLIIQSMAQVIAQQMMMMGTPEGQIQSMLGGLSGVGAPEGGGGPFAGMSKPGGGNGHVGRPPTAQEPPHIEVKGDMRSTIAES